LHHKSNEKKENKENISQMKKHFCLLLLLIFYLSGYSQQIAYFGKNHQQIASPKDAVSYLKTTVDTLMNLTTVLSCKINGDSVYEHHLLSKNGHKHGVQRGWFSNGQIAFVENYKFGKLDGTVTTFWKNGKVKRKDLFDRGTFVKGECFDSLGIEIPHFDYRVAAQFPGGHDALINYLNHNIRYPVKAQENGIEGKVILQFTVYEDGTIHDIKVLKSVIPELDEEACRVIESMPKWIPGKRDGKLTRVTYTLPANFKLPFKNADKMMPTPNF